jgi:hypothetical protein
VCTCVCVYVYVCLCVYVYVYVYVYICVCVCMHPKQMPQKAKKKTQKGPKNTTVDLDSLTPSGPPENYTECLTTRMFPFRADPYVQEFEAGTLLVNHYKATVRPVQNKRVEVFSKLWLSGMRWNVALGTASVVLLGDEFTPAERGKYLGAYIDGNHRGQALNIAAAASQDHIHTVAKFVTTAAVYLNTLPLGLAREFGRWVNGMQMLATNQTFIDNLVGMNGVVEIMVEENNNIHRKMVIVTETERKAITLHNKKKKPDEKKGCLHGQTHSNRQPLTMS